MSIAPQQAARSCIITVGGGKGGVGKSIVALNLAAVLAHDGYQVVIADMDLGAANQHLLLGLRNPAMGLQDLLDKSVKEAKTLPERDPGTQPAAAGRYEWRARRRQYHPCAEGSPACASCALSRRTSSSSTWVPAWDTTRSISSISACASCSSTTPQVTALHDAYAFLKSAVLRLLRHNVEEEIDAALLEPATLSTSSEKVVQILARLRETRPALADKVFAAD